MANLRVIEHPEEACEIFALDVLKSVGIVVVRAELLLVAAAGRAVELLAEKQGLAFEEVTVDSVEVVFDLGAHVSAQ